MSNIKPVPKPAKAPERNKNVQIKLSEEEYEALDGRHWIAQMGIQDTARDLVLRGLGMLDPEPGAWANANIKWHEKLEYILQNGDPDDLIGIQRNLEWAHHQIRTNKPSRKRA